MIRTQTTYSKEINKRYDRKCVISGATHSLDACHIIDKSVCDKIGNNILKFHKANGILMRKDLHKSFDDHNWCFNPYDVQSERDNFMKIGVVYNINSPNDLKRGEYYTILRDSYRLIHIRYTEYLHHNLVKNGVNNNTNNYSILDLQPMTLFVRSIDKDGDMYDAQKDTIMLNACH